MNKNRIIFENILVKNLFCIKNYKPLIFIKLKILKTMIVRTGIYWRVTYRYIFARTNVRFKKLSVPTVQRENQAEKAGCSEFRI